MDIIDLIIGRENLSENEIILLETSLIFLISLPIVTTITGIFRHIIGLKSLSIHAPIILTYAFYQLGKIIDSEPLNYSYERGLIFGLLLFILVFLVSTILYNFLGRVRMHYVPKTTLILIGTSVSLLTVILLGTTIFDKKGLIYLDIFSIVMVATLSELFISQLARKSLRQTVIISTHTLVSALISYSLISIDQVRILILEQSIIVIGLIIILNIYIGKFIGLRIYEYWRFRDLLISNTQPNKKKYVSTNQKSTKK